MWDVLNAVLEMLGDGLNVLGVARAGGSRPEADAVPPAHPLDSDPSLEAPDMLDPARPQIIGDSK